MKYNVMMLEALTGKWVTVKTCETKEEAMAAIPNDKRDPANGINVPISYLFRVQEVEG